MKKNILLFSLLLFAPLFSLTGCNQNGTQTTSQSATIVITPNEHAKIECSISSLSGSSGDRGTLTITPDKDYYVNSVTQNDMFPLLKVEDNVYSFTLLSGENVFTVKLDYVETEESNSELIGQGNEVVITDGELTDEVDPIPSLGSGTTLLPEYDNPITVYFKDSDWWNTSAASTNILVYDENDKVISYNPTLGEMMTHITYNAQSGFNYWQAILDGDKASKIQFIRTGDNGFTDWGARTEVLPLPTAPNDMYILDSTAAWYGDGNYASVTEGIYNPDNDPEPVDLGVYTIYFETNSWWNALSTDAPNCYMWGANGDRSAWPGSAMTKVSDNLYSIDFDTEVYTQCIFNTNAGAYQTADLRVPLTFGKDASIIAKLPATDPGSKNCTVEWSLYIA